MKKRIRRGDPQKQRYWEAVVRRCREGGQSVRAFCLAEGLRESAFYFWRRKLARRSQLSGAVGQPRPEASTLALAAPSPKRLSPPRRSPASFLPVRVVGPASGCPAATETTRSVEIVLAHGRTVRVQAGFDRQTLADVLAVLEAQPC
jgi:transposase-like protein